MSMTIFDVAFQQLDSLSPLDKTRLEESRFFSGSTLVVPHQSSALEIARIVDQTGSSQVLLTDEVGTIVGLVVANIVRKQISEHMNVQAVETLYKAVELLVNDPTEDLGQYRDWLNSARHNDFWCTAGRHYTDENPCSKHSGKSGS